MSLVLHERRSGFDRRRSRSRVRRATNSVLLFLRAEESLLFFALLAVNILNVADLAATLRALDLGAIEVNPLMHFLLGQNALLAAAAKIVMVGTASIAVWRLRRFRSALAVGVVMIFWFWLIIVYQLGALVSATS